MAMMKRMVSFTAPQDEYLKREAGRLGISISDLVRRIVDAYRSQAVEGRRRPMAPLVTDGGQDAAKKGKSRRRVGR